MRPRRRLAPFLLLNILVSALTTLLVLWVWDLTHRSEIPASFQGSITSAQMANPTLPPAEQLLIEVDNVFGVGIAESESVRLKRVSSGELWLTDWKLEDQDGNSFTFPKLNFVGGTLEIFTRPGVDTPISLYWESDKPIWRIGETVTLRDYEGTIRAKYIIR